jgi:very-short-patch-repair endonuclease
MSQLDKRLADVAARQRMLITINDVYVAGGNTDHAIARVRGGRWLRVERGVYLVAGAELNWQTKLLAAILAAGPGSAASHLAAARLWGLPGFNRAGLELTMPRDRGYRRGGVRTHESTDLDRCRVVLREDVPVTDPDRTLLDLCRYVGDGRSERVIEAARRAELATWSSLIATLATHARRGRPGVQRLRRAILLRAHREEVTDTDMELLVLSLLVEAGLPEPVLHHQVHDRNRFVAEVDLAYPDWKIAIECDGSVHLDPAVRERDLARQNDLVLLGWTILRFSWDRVRQRPELVVSEVRAAVRTAQRP